MIAIQSCYMLSRVDLALAGLSVLSSVCSHVSMFSHVYAFMCLCSHMFTLNLYYVTLFTSHGDDVIKLMHSI